MAQNANNALWVPAHAVNNPVVDLASKIANNTNIQIEYEHSKIPEFYCEPRKDSLCCPVPSAKRLSALVQYFNDFTYCVTFLIALNKDIKNLFNSVPLF
jgi:hypothetical protein